MLADDPGGDARRHAPVGDLAADHGTRRDDDVPADPRAGSTIAPAPSHEPAPIATGRFTGRWRPIGVSVSS